jgi:DNA helicase-2/ATP-dependent DNA helicase PcrA
MSLGSAAELEEERRLLYVALTRAQDALIVTYPTRYYFRGNPLDDAHAYSQPSRFLSGLTAFDRASVGEDVVEDDPVRHELAALWD